MLPPCGFSHAGAGSQSPIKPFFKRELINNNAIEILN
jgi:hypothetical protein